jgi:hypothetical protein
MRTNVVGGQDQTLQNMLKLIGAENGRSFISHPTRDSHVLGPEADLPVLLGPMSKEPS